MTDTWTFVKGHGTANDFVILVDGPDPTAEQVAALCDRRRGVGGDGILRAMEVDGELFMDYRNADGSLAEMCGNGIRVFARWLVDTGRAAAGTWPVQTRSGVRRVSLGEAGDVDVDMGRATLGAPALVHLFGQQHPATAVDLGNPHLVVGLSEEEVSRADLTRAPRVEPPPAAGVNVELVAQAGADHVRMRVHERGVGETQSCGTGACAAAVAAAQWAGAGPDGRPWTVDVPGGRLLVTWTEEAVHLVGPAVLVASGTVTL